MKLSRVGEIKAIESLRRRYPDQDAEILIGIGDDAAVWRPKLARSLGRDLLITTDALVEGVDFDQRTALWHQVGFKAMASNLSDLAAMGGQPRFFLVTLGFPAQTGLDQFHDLYDGMLDLARDFRVKLIGGDLSESRGGLFVNITLLGTAERGRAVLRSGAHVGDDLYVTGTLGDSAAGLECVQSLGKRHAPGGGRMEWPLVHRHFYPQPRVAEGRWLSRHRVVSAMVDLSDGLSTDLRHLCQASRVGAEVELQALPVSGALQQHATRRGRRPLDYVLHGGEDFELLFTVPPSKSGELLRRSRRFAWRRIGRILPRAKGIVIRNEKGRCRPLPAGGYEHFRSGTGRGK